MLYSSFVLYRFSVSQDQQQESRIAKQINFDIDLALATHVELSSSSSYFVLTPSGV